MTDFIFILYSLTHIHIQQWIQRDTETHPEIGRHQDKSRERNRRADRNRGKQIRRERKHTQKDRKRQIEMPCERQRETETSRDRGSASQAMSLKSALSLPHVAKPQSPRCRGHWPGQRGRPGDPRSLQGQSRQGQTSEQVTAWALSRWPCTLFIPIK